ncbi:MAG TPA: hypothetical protein VIC27_09285 [Ktedonobacterales bacterium]
MIAQTTPTTTSSTRSAISRLEVAGILLMMAGDGYINGNFIQPINVGWGVFIDIVHLIPLAILLWLGIELLRTVDTSGAATNRRRGLRIGVTIMAVLAVITSLVMIGLGTFDPSLGVGVQAFSDWLAVILAGGGAVLWFVTMFLGRRA